MSAKDFNKKDLLTLFNLTKSIKDGTILKLEGKRIALLFFEPSTRTYNSFKVAAEKLGCEVDGFLSVTGTSVAKGESLLDTARMFMNYGADCIVLRHPRAGAPKYLAEKVEIPVINAGDDSHEHPTQAMLDVFTIWEKFKVIDGLKIGIMGDLRYGRTPSSLSFTLLNWRVKLYFIAPPQLQVDKRNDDMEHYLQTSNARYEKVEDVTSILPELDVLYVTRIQKERFMDPTEFEKVRGSYTITRELLNDAKDSLIVLHPLPRVDELAPDVDSTKHAFYFKQAQNGLFVRMALLSLILGETLGS